MYTSYYLEGFFENEQDELILREARGLQHFYKNAEIVINDNHLIKGRLDAAQWKEVVTFNYSCNHRHMDRFNALPDDHKAMLHDKFERMKEYAHHETIRSLASPEELLVEDSGAAFCQKFNGHMILGYEYILSVGLDGVRKNIESASKDNDRKSFYDALLMTLEGIQTYILRHGEKNIAHEPPKTFREAVQLQWFMMCFGDYDSFGRYDQYMYPFYKKDPEGALELVKDMMRRVEDNGSIINMTIGGRTPSGENAVNELTYIILRATRELLFKGPNLCLRMTKDSDPALWREAGENLGTGQALPALYNDDVFIPMLLSHGISQEDANDYSLAGCSQAIIAGKSNFACDMGLYTPAKILELALHNGFDPVLKKQVGPKTGDATAFTSFEQLMAAYTAQMKYCVEKGVSLNNQDHTARRQFLSCVRTIFTQNCVRSGLGIFEGGAVYNGIQGEVVGITNAANSLAAIQTLVYEQKAISMPELIQALADNFNNHDSLRQKLLHEAPKFGNNIQSVDEIRSKIARDIYMEISSYAAPLGGVHWPGEVIFDYHMSQARYIGALPDGKRAGEPLADSAGPSQGTDINGVTAVINSMANSISELSPEDTPYTSINLNLKFDKNLWKQHKDKMLSLFQTYFMMGGPQLQINMLDREALLDAMENPERYRDLVVRVGGFSAYFTQLSEETQREIVSRTMSQAS